MKQRRRSTQGPVVGREPQAAGRGPQAAGRGPQAAAEPLAAARGPQAVAGEPQAATQEPQAAVLGPLAVLVALVALTALLAVAGCNDSAGPDDGADVLTGAEAVALVDGLAVVGRLTGEDVTVPVTGEPAIHCPLGGIVGISGTFSTDSTETTQVLRSEIVMTPVDCGFAARGVTFTTNGAPDVRQVGDVTITGFFERVELDYDITGAVEWETGSPVRRGTCTLDLDLTGEYELPGVEATDTVGVLRGTLSGTACDAAVDLPLDSIGGGSG